MTQQPYETEASATTTGYSSAFRVLAIAVLALFVVLIGNAIYTVRHRAKSMSALALQPSRLAQNEALAREMAAQPQPIPPPDPDAFDETRDGSDSLSLEDENGKASVWEDKKSGSRIFCLDSCIVLPASKIPGVLSTKTVPKK